MYHPLSLEAQILQVPVNSEKGRQWWIIVWPNTEVTVLRMDILKSCNYTQRVKNTAEKKAGFIDVNNKHEHVSMKLLQAVNVFKYNVQLTTGNFPKCYIKTRKKSTWSFIFVDCYNPIQIMSTRPNCLKKVSF